MLPDFNKFKRSLRYAWNGLCVASAENNFRIHLIAAIVVFVAGLCFSISRIEWCVVSLSIGVVLAAELFNTAIEKLCDHLHPDQHPNIGKVKDLSAAAVLMVSVGALIVGVSIFWEYMLELTN